MKLDDASKISTIVIGLVTLFFAYKASTWDNTLKEIEAADRIAKIEYEKLGFDREFKFKIYQLTIDAIKSKDTAQQEAAYMTVSSMVTDTVFKSGLLSLFVKSKAVSPELRKAATVAKFDINESREPNPVYSLRDKIYVDIIYLENVPRAKSVARKIYNALKTSDYYEVGIKTFSPKLNQTSIYQISENLIRFDKDEEAKAEKLQEVVNQILPEGTSLFVTGPTAAGKPTRQYISLFVVK